MGNVARRLIGAAIIGLVGVCAGSAQTKAGAALPFLHAAGTAIADDQNQPVRLRGCNLGNWLLLEPWMLGMSDGAIHDQSGIERALSSRFGEGETQRLLDLYRENWITERDFDRLKAWGLNVVRLPFHCDLLLDKTNSGELKPDAFRWLDRAVDMARKAGIYVVLDLHGAPGGQSVDGVTGQSGRNQFWTAENRRLGASLWRKIAEHYAAEPAVAAYDLLNEPYGTMNSENHDADLVGAMDQMIQAIRTVDDRHLIFCAGSFRGIESYGNLHARGWKNVGFTEHFYPGLYGGIPTLETHARFIGSNLAGRASLLKAWDVPYYVGEFNVVLDQAGGADTMRRYFDTFGKYGWAGTFWSYKLLNRDGGVHPNHWYMVTNREGLTPPDFLADSMEQIEAFCRSLGTMDVAEADDLHNALTAKIPPPLPLGSYAPVTLPEQRKTLAGWTDTDVGDAFPRGGHTVVGQQVQIYGGGRDVYEGSDEFHLVSRPMDGDFSVRADVSLPAPTHIYAKSGLMFRASTAVNAPLVMLSLKPNGQCILAHRTSPGARIIEEQLDFEAGASTLQLTRRGNTFEAVVSGEDGSRRAVKTLTLPELAGNGVAGPFVLSHDAMLLTEASFGRVELKTSGAGSTSVKP